MQDLELAAGKVVRHMLFMHAQKPGHPVARTKLVDLIKEDFQ